MKPTPQRPDGPGWSYLGWRTLPYGRAEAWAHVDGVFCLSAVDLAEKDYHGSGVVFPHFHVSATHRAGEPRSCTDQEMELVRAAFGMGGAEEDNHGPGIARHLWIACWRAREPVCPCKKDQDRTVEGPRVRHEEAAGA